MINEPLTRSGLVLGHLLSLGCIKVQRREVVQRIPKLSLSHVLLYIVQTRRGEEPKSRPYIVNHFMKVVIRFGEFLVLASEAAPCSACFRISRGRVMKGVVLFMTHSTGLPLYVSRKMRTSGGQMTKPRLKQF